MLLAEADPASAPPARPASRHDHILDAFERCIVRKGFHATSMHDVAQEAGMSAGNLYRYFPSKDALVLGMTERDRTRFSTDFARVADAPNVIGAFEAMGRHYLVEEPRERCIGLVEIWAEASRNPAVRNTCLTMQLEVQGRIATLLRRAQAKGEIAPDVDCESLTLIILALGDGFMQRRALDPAFDPEVGFGHVMAVFDAVLDGKLVPGRRTRPSALPFPSECMP